jgi:hypothetical protein
MACVAVSLATAGAALADNIRPTVVNTSGANGELTLTQVFDSLSVAGGGAAGDIHVSTQQSTYSTFNAIAPTSASMIIEIAGNKNSNSFGIYNIYDSSKTAQIFSGTATAGATATLTFLINGSVDVTIGATTTNYLDIGTDFGFYIGASGGDFYSEDAHNAGGVAQGVIYRGAGESIELNGVDRTFLTSDWIVAWEDIAYAGSDKDYNDMVVYVSGLAPVPEPGTLALLGGGLALGLLARRRRTAARSA